MDSGNAGVPSVAVIIPTLPPAEYLQAAIDSVLHDEFDGRLQVVVVVDGAQEHVSGAFLADPRVTVVATGAASGSAAATNFGATVVDADFLARMDADDLVLPGKLAAQLAYFAENPDVVATAATGIMIDEGGRPLGPYPSREDDDIRGQLLTRNPVIHSSLVIRRSAFDAVGGYDPKCIRMQDYELILRLARAGRVAMVPGPFVAYRVHPGQTGRVPRHFLRLMGLIGRRRLELASHIGRPRLRQRIHNVVFSVGQALRYAGLREPRYAKAARQGAE